MDLGEHRTNDRRPVRPTRGPLADRRASRRAALALPVVLLLTLLATAGTAAAVPEGFDDLKVADVNQPTALAFTPDGRSLITGKAGVLFVRASGDPVGGTATALDISAKVCTNFERGLLGVAVDPDFATNRYVYLYYTFKKYPTCDRDTAKVPVNRVSRFVMNGDRIAPASEKILLDNITSRHGNHNAGDLNFGQDEYLYVSIGDSGCDLNDTVASDLCGADNTNARRSHLLLGKIARITREGGIPRDNPYTGPDSRRCALTGRTAPGYRCQETFASGLRNPFRFAFDPNASGTRFLINDVGQGMWEEIDEGRKGVDYGWNQREGFCATNTTTCNYRAAPAPFTNPVHHYNHNQTNCGSITGGAIVPKGVWPAAYDGNYLFADFVCGGLYRLQPDGNGGWQRPAGGAVGTPFVPKGDGRPVHLRFGPAPDGQALYYTTFDNGGEVHRIGLSGTTNRRPNAAATAEPAEGGAPLEFAFDGRGSTDPDAGPDDVLEFRWDFGDGTPVDSTSGARANHVYGEPGQYTATLTVSDPDGGTDTATVAIDAGNQLPRAVIESPTGDTPFAAEERITLTGRANDADGNALPGAELTWEVLLHHNTHAHPFLEESGNNVTFDAPFPEDLDAAESSYLEIRLTATVNGRKSRTVSRDLNPNKVELTFDTSPTGLDVVVNGKRLAGGGTITSWEGWRLRVDAPAQSPNGQGYELESWSDDPDAKASRVLTTPDGNATLTATFRPVTIVEAVADARVFQARPGGNDGRGRALSTGGGRGAVVESYLRFPVAGLDGPVERATLRLWVPDGNGTGAPAAPAVFVTAPRWTERGLTWENRPPRQAAAGAATTGAVAGGSWVALDVTQALRAGASAFVVASARSDGIVFSSREGSNPPQLSIETGAGPAATEARVERASAPADGALRDSVTEEPTTTRTADAETGGQGGRRDRDRDRERERPRGDADTKRSADDPARERRRSQG